MKDPLFAGTSKTPFFFAKNESLHSVSNPERVNVLVFDLTLTRLESHGIEFLKTLSK